MHNEPDGRIIIIKMVESKDNAYVIEFTFYQNLIRLHTGAYGSILLCLTKFPSKFSNTLYSGD